MRGRDILLRGAARPSLTAQVQALFAGGKVGGMWDMGDTATLFQDAAGATPVTAVTQPIGRVNDKSGNGNHALQSTSTARPKLSARVNLLTKTEDFSDAVWNKSGVTPVYGVNDRLGGTKAVRITSIATNAFLEYADYVGDWTTKTKASGVWVRRVSGTGLVYLYAGSEPALDITSAISSGAWTFVSNSSVGYATFTITRVRLMTISDSIEVCFPSDILGSTVTADDYQRVNTASDYDTVGFPAFAQFDGTDDELFTGALTPNSDMDCFIAIYRNSAAHSVVAYDQLTGGFCVMDSGDAASTATFGIPATNTYAVDGVSVAGGTGTTRAQLASAVSPGAWHIIEARNLNLSSFSPLRVGNYGPTWPLEGKIGGIVLISALSTEDRNLVRTYLGSKVGLTL